jgi:hypothetical protein
MNEHECPENANREDDGAASREAAHPAAPEPPVYRAPPGRPVRASWLLAGGLFAATLTLISFFYTAQWYRAGAENRLLVAIAEEIAASHLEPRPREVEGPTLDAVLAYFTELDFQPVSSPRLGGPGDTLLGGRYCSIQGVSAVQLQYRSPEGTVSTWYEGTMAAHQLAALPDVDAGARPFRHLVRGVDVSIWQANGLLFAAAGARAAGTGDVE